MERQKLREIISILMESSLYLELPLKERWIVIQTLAPKINWC
ncbi:MAG: hypothetical protein QMD01_08675 [Thermodesulfovibrionales bacterium]|nr:hypothetical protein [Thermodesulfovibrionales bacterium]